MVEDLETIDKWLKEEYGLSYTELNNIINEFEKWLDEELKDGNLQDSYYGGMRWKSVKAQYMERTIKKLQELKGVDKE